MPVSVCDEAGMATFLVVLAGFFQVIVLAIFLGRLHPWRGCRDIVAVLNNK